MKTVVSLHDLLELEIRPAALLSEYHALTEGAVRAWPAAALREVACPACASDVRCTAFERFGLTYRECLGCGTVYLSPRPSEQMLTAYVRDSAPAQFWRDRVMPATHDVRREKILMPRADWLAEGIAEYAPAAESGLDLTPHAQTSVAALTPSPLRRVIAAHPAADLEVHAVPGRIEVRPGVLLNGEPVGPVDVVIAFETLDCAGDLPGLLHAVWRVLKPGGLLFVTASSISGFDLQVLWESARSVAPPDKINLLSTRGFLALFGREWDVIEFSTPGMFDVETVRLAVENDPAGDWPRFVRTMMLDPNERVRTEFQLYLQRARLASFARLLLRRRG